MVERPASDLRPGELRPNRDQEKAIARRDRDVFVTAAAGSGKTRAMTERFVAAVIDDGVPVDEILTITFTNEAAAQLQRKVKAALEKAGRIEESRRLHDAYISTFHKFCARILTTHPFAAGIDPRFTVLEGLAATTAVNEAMDRALEAFVSESEERLAFVSDVGKDALSKTLISLFEAIRSAGFIEPADGMPPNPATRQDKAVVDEAVIHLRHLLSGLVDGADRANGNAKYVKNLGRAEELLSLLHIEEEVTRPGLLDFKFDEQCTFSREDFKLANRLMATVDALLTEDIACRHHGYYTELLRLLSSSYRDVKAQVSGLDFEDMQLYAMQVLERHPGLRAWYRSKFKLIMVDEFQDTNRLQYNLIDLLANDNLFTVGDKFQSIYQFRHADVSVFEGLRAQTAPDDVVSFPKNYRSRGEVLAAVNRIGASPKFFGDEHLWLEAERDRREFKRADGPAVELCLVDTAWQERTAVEAEAGYIARRINEVLAGKADGASAYTENDIAILIPTRTKLKEIEDALKAHGIPFYTVKGKGYYGTDEVSEIRDLLTVMVNPYDDLALVGTLRGPCVRLSDDALYLLRKHAGRDGDRDNPLWHGVMEGGAPLDEGDASKLERFVGILEGLRRHAAHAGLASVVERAVGVTGYDLCALMRDHNGRLRYANIKKLMRLADAYQEVNGPSLAGFVEYLARQEELSGQEGEAVLADEDIGAVRIMTIHASKGLQFPVVFLALSQARPRYADGALALYRSPKGALDGQERGSIGLRVPGIGGVVDAPGYPELKEKLARDTDAEDKRLLHVAMTRAEEYLAITGICNIDKKTAATAKNNTYIEWLMAALGIGHHDTRDARDAGAYLWNEGGIDCRVHCESRLSRYEADPAGTTGPRNAGPRYGLSGDPAIDLTPVTMPVGSRAHELTYTSMETYRQCPRKFYLRHVADIRPDGLALEGAGTKGSVPAASFGTIVHEILEALDIKALAEGGYPRSLKTSRACLPPIRSSATGFACA